MAEVVNPSKTYLPCSVWRTARFLSCRPDSSSENCPRIPHSFYFSTSTVQPNTDCMRILLLISLFMTAVLSDSKAQHLDHRLGYVIIQLQKDVAPESLISTHATRMQGELTIDRILSKRLGIYLVRFDHVRIHEGKLLDDLRADARIQVAQFDHIPSLRIIPDDPQLPAQWQWLNTGQTGGTADADIDADEAWNTTRGGVTAAGDTIVVAIIDDGLDYTHEDIAANAWYNYHEIDGNGVDDDNNGYIDDVRGWNAYDNTPDVWGNNHGLNVAGMVGAVGNNQIGVTGINWNVKLMMVVGGIPESSAIASYAYVLEQRILYNETQGAKGAFVVATNSSWGVDFGQPADAPLWCAFYDSLGVHGILSAAATANLNIDVDAVGDLPTACPSEYLLSVTALNHNNERTFSGYGVTQIDFGAPGEDIFTTRRNNGYGSTSGTSFASPVTAGVIALLYSAPCQAFSALAHADPAGAALYIRDLIFQGVEPVVGLEGTLRFGGNINAGNSMELMMSLCQECPVPFAVETEILSDTEASVTWSMVDTADAVNARIKPVNATEWDTLFDVTQPLLLSNLEGCTTYEIEFESVCSDTTTGFQSNHQFETLGCCERPDGLEATTTETSATVSWQNVFAADFYIIQWRPESGTEWLEDATTENTITLHNLEGCTYYEIRVQTNCDTTEAEYSDTITIRTKGCGFCVDYNYCESVGLDASEEYIDSVTIGSLHNPSGSNDGYQLFEDFKPKYIAGKSYPVRLRPGFIPGNSFNENFRVWLDANQDGTFDEEELLVDSLLSAQDEVVISQMNVPEATLAGSTRMRVSMAFSNPFFPTTQGACDQVDFGEVEDYCVEILRNPDDCPEVDTVQFDAITFTSAYMYWPSTEGAIAYTYRWRETGTTDYEEVATIDTTANLTGLEKCKTYEVQIRTICVNDTTSYNENYLLETDCDVAVRDLHPFLTTFNSYPNPTTDVVTLRMQPYSSGQYAVALYNMQGQKISQDVRYADAETVTEIRFDQLVSYPSGLYFIVVERDGKTATRKIVKL